MNSLKKAARVALLILPLSASLFCKKSKKENGNVEPPGAVEIEDSVIVSGLSYPWEIYWGPDNAIWMTERAGKVSRVNPVTGVVTPLLTIPGVITDNESGLLGLTLHPNFPTTPHVFVVYNYDNGGYRERVVRYTYNGTILTSPFTVIENISASPIHNGSRLLIVGDKLFITTGDAASMGAAQVPLLPNGKILRLNLDGTIPADNPVAGNPYWTLGHRNPQGLVYANNKLYCAEHGPTTDDEVNIIEKGRNYGWPNVAGACDEPGEQTFCTSNNVAQPIASWTPTIACSGMDYYNGNMIPQWKNSLLVVALKNARLYQLKLKSDFATVENTNEYFTNKYGRMRDVCVSPEGKVFICTSNGGNDKIIEVRKAN